MLSICKILNWMTMTSLFPRHHQNARNFLVWIDPSDANASQKTVYEDWNIKSNNPVLSGLMSFYRGHSICNPNPKTTLLICWYLDIYIKQQHFRTLLFLLLGGVRKKGLRKFFQMDGPFSANLVSISAITVYELECHDFLDCLLVWNCANSSWAIRTSYSICSLAKF